MSNPKENKRGGIVGLPRNRQPGKGVLGSKLRTSRFQARMTLSAVADLIGVAAHTVGTWELGKAWPPAEQVEKLAQIFDWDETPAPATLPRKEAPVAVTPGLRTATNLAALKDPIPLTPNEAQGLANALSNEEDEFSLRRLKRSAQYVSDNIPHLVELYEKTLREMHRLEQRMSGGMTTEQVETLRDKARRYDEIMDAIKRKNPYV